jgi:hypothetical protein
MQNLFQNWHFTAYHASMNYMFTFLLEQNSMNTVTTNTFSLNQQYMQNTLQDRRGPNATQGTEQTATSPPQSNLKRSRFWIASCSSKTAAPPRLLYNPATRPPRKPESELCYSTMPVWIPNIISIAARIKSPTYGIHQVAYQHLDPKTGAIRCKIRA